MNLFNCFQAVTIYTIAPLGIQYLATNGYSTWAIILGVMEFVGFIAISISISDSMK